MFKFKRHKRTPEPTRGYMEMDGSYVTDGEGVTADAPEFSDEEVKQRRERFQFDEVRGRFEKRDGVA